MVVFSQRQLQTILKKMCEIAELNYDDIDFDNKESLKNINWSKMQKYEFIIWLERRLQKRRNLTNMTKPYPVSKDMVIRNAIVGILNNYGFKVE